ncbi:MAG: hypothetical protein Q7S44_01705 [bacterium]|nr:hypothetical protein [bacterium]
MQKGFALIFILVGALVLVGLGGAFYFGKLKFPQTSFPGNPSITVTPQVSPTPTPKADETANWKTYTNTKYGYSFKYSPDSNIKEERGRDDIGLPDHALITNRLGEIRIPYLAPPDWRNSGVKEINIDGKTGKKFLVDNSYNAQTPYVVIVIIPNAIKYTKTSTLTFIYIPTSKNIEKGITKEESDYFDKFLSTFNFLDQKQVCEIDKEYLNTAINPMECICPEGSKQTIVSTGWGPCPSGGMKDCPKTVIKCKR